MLNTSGGTPHILQSGCTIDGDTNQSRMANADVVEVAPDDDDVLVVADGVLNRSVERCSNKSSIDNWTKGSDSSSSILTINSLAPTVSEAEVDDDVPAPATMATSPNAIHNSTIELAHRTAIVDDCCLLLLLLLPGSSCFFQQSSTNSVIAGSNTVDGPNFLVHEMIVLVASVRTWALSLPVICCTSTCRNVSDTTMGRVPS